MAITISADIVNGKSKVGKLANEIESIADIIIRKTTTKANLRFGVLVALLLPRSMALTVLSILALLRAGNL